MKKIFNLILAALVIIGAAACTKSEEIVDQTQQGEGLSFYAEIVNGNTRAEIVKGDGNTWNTIWEEGDNVYVSLSGEDPYTFTYANGKFTCTDDGVTSLIGETVTVGPCNVNEDSTAGKKAWSFTGTKVEKFDNNATVNLTADTSFFRYTYNGTGDVTITVTPKEGDTKVFSYCVKEDVFDYYPSITFKGAAEDKFVGFWPQTLSGLEATLSYSINGVMCKETSITLATGKVYNLGTLTDPELATVYLVPGVWASDGARFAVYEIDTETWTSMTAVEGQIGTYTAKVATSNIILTRMNPANEVNSWDNKWNQTADLVVPTDDKNCYYITGWGTDSSVGEWHEVGYVPPVPSITWALAGDFNSWGDLVMQSTDTANIFVAKGVELAAGSEFKVKDSKSWDTSYGRGVKYLAANSYMTVIQGGNDNNISIAQSGTYDVYFEYLGANSHLYLMKANADYKTAKEQTADGALVPDQPQGETPGLACAWSVSGTHNGWGDTPMVTTTVKNLYVAKSVKLDAYASFKVRKDKAWTEGYGGGIVYMNPNGYIQVYQGGSDISNTAAGTFDIYFDYTNKYLYLVDAGTDYTKVSKQTAEGKEPVQEEPEVTDKTLYLKPNANWKQSNARFAAYFFGGKEKWVSMTDADKDGIYEVNIPEGYDYGCNVIFCRMNPNTTANNWNNKWNQTSDLKAPTDGKNLYTVKEGTWDKGGGTWSVKQ